MRVPADEVSSKRASIRDELLTQEAANTVSQAVSVGVDVSEAPYIDGPLSRSGTFCIISHLCAWSSVWRCRLPQVCL